MHVAEMIAKRENIHFLPGVSMPPEIESSSDMRWTVDGAELVVLAVPSHAMRETCTRLPQLNLPVVSVTKGIENETGKRMSEIIA